MVPRLEERVRASSHIRYDLDRLVATRLSIAASWDELVRAADAGNADAAFQLAQDALRCASMSERREILESNAAVTGDKFVLDNAVKQLAEDGRLCMGITQEQIGSKSNWIVRAARLGNSDAKLMFLGAATEQFDEPEKIVANAEELTAIKLEALQHLKSAAAQGNPTTMANLADTYKNGILAGRDDVMAYGYLLALQGTGTSQLAVRKLNDWASEMTPAEIAAAQAVAARILKGDEE